MGETHAKTIDVRGEFCPVPVIELAKAVKQVEMGRTVRLLCTDPGVHSDMPAWCKSTRHDLVSIESSGREIEVVVRRRK